MMTTMECNDCRNSLADLLLEGSAPPPALAAHMAACADCRQEWQELRATWTLMDEWTAPEPTPYFDTRLQARLRDLQHAAPEGLWERFANYLHFSTGRGLRSAMAGALAVAVVLGGGTAATLLTHHTVSPNTSPTVIDLRIYDKNAQALQEMDLLDEPGPDSGSAPQS